MLILFVVYLYPNVHTNELLSEEMVEHSKVQLMTLAQADKLGFKGIPPHPQGGDTWVIVASRRDANWIQRSLDSNPAVAQYQQAEVET